MDDRFKITHKDDIEVASQKEAILPSGSKRVRKQVEKYCGEDYVKGANNKWTAGRMIDPYDRQF